MFTAVIGIMEAFGAPTVLVIFMVIAYFKNKANNKKITDLEEKSKAELLEMETRSDESLKKLEDRLEKVEGHQLKADDITLAVLVGIKPLQANMNSEFTRLYDKLSNYVPIPECKALREGMKNLVGK